MIELLVSVTILTLISTLSVVNYRASNSTLLLEAHKIVADLRRAQTMSLNSSEFSGSVPLGGWGINFSHGAGTYVIFADLDNDGLYNNANDGLLETNTLSNGITFTSSDTNVTYQPPDPTNYIDGQLSGTTEKIITLTKGADSRSITVNFAGLVDINEE